MAMSISWAALAFTPALTPPALQPHVATLSAAALAARRSHGIGLQMPDLGKMGGDFMGKMGLVRRCPGCGGSARKRPLPSMRSPLAEGARHGAQ